MRASSGCRLELRRPLLALFLRCPSIRGECTTCSCVVCVVGSESRVQPGGRMRRAGGWSTSHRGGTSVGAHRRQRETMHNEAYPPRRRLGAVGRGRSRLLTVVGMRPLDGELSQRAAKSVRTDHDEAGASSKGTGRAGTGRRELICLLTESEPEAP
jgi:hypothetical protein